MKYRTMKNSGDKLSNLGFGCMRFPTDKDGKIDTEKSEKMLDYAIENGVNYLDTAYPYHKEESEKFVGKYLEKRNIRDKLKLATKLPSWFIKEESDFEKYLNIQLERLKTDHIDYYLLHALNKNTWKSLNDLDVFKHMEKAKAEGKIVNIGFSFHDGLSLFKEIVDSYDWSFCQIQYNYLDLEFQAGKEGFEYAAAKGLDIIIMEPLRGGNLTTNVPDDIMNEWNRAAIKRSPAEWALRWLWNDERVNIILSGMSTLDQVKENIETAENSTSNSLTEEELKLVEKVGDMYRAKMKVPCTSCRYCLPCPHGIAIPAAFSPYNNAFMFNDMEKAKKMYFWFVPEDKRASKCVQCGECIPKCPQQINIIDELKKVAEFFEK